MCDCRVLRTPRVEVEISHVVVTRVEDGVLAVEDGRDCDLSRDLEEIDGWLIDALCELEGRLGCSN